MFSTHLVHKAGVVLYLIKQNQTFHYRARVPADLIPILGKRELRFTLKTTNRKRAKKMAKALSQRLRTAFNKVRCSKMEVFVMIENGTLSRDELNSLLRAYVLQELELFDQEEAEGRPLNSDTLDRELEGYEIALFESKVSLSERRHVSFMGRTVNAILEEAGLPLDKESEAYKRLCHEVLKASIRILEANKKKLVGDFQGTDPMSIMRDLGIRPYPVRVERSADAIAERSAGADSKQTPKPSISLSQLIDDYQSRQVQSGLWTEVTVRNHSPKLKALLQFLGDRPVAQVTIDRLREYAKALELLPPRFAVLKEYRDISGLDPRKLEGRHTKTLDPTTRREYLNLTRSLFNFAVENQYIPSNPVISGIIPPKKKKTRDQREAFTMDDLARIFDPEVYLKWAEGKPERFYIPLLLVFTGCRLEEVASLYCADVFIKDGLWCIEVNDNHDRRVKNQNAIRSIPLHPLLVDQFKFPEYVEGLKGERVFPALKPVNFKYGHEFSKRFGYYLRNKVGISSPKKSLHSFRHTVSDYLYKKLVMESLIEELTGRAGKTETRNRYTKGYRAKELYEEAILKLDYEVDLSGLQVSHLI